MRANRLSITIKRLKLTRYGGCQWDATGRQILDDVRPVMRSASSRFRVFLGFHDDDFVAVEDVVEAVRDEEDGGAATEDSVDGRLDDSIRRWVDGRRRFV